MSYKTTVSVCIPTFNRAALLAEAIESVLDQTVADFELLVVDNASTDDTQAVVGRYRDSRIRYHRQKTNVGIAENHRTAVSMATGEYIAILSDDDLFLANHLEIALAALTDFPSAAYYTCALQRFGSCEQGIWYPAGIKNRAAPLVYYSPSQAVDFLGIENPGFLNTIVCHADRFKHDIFWGKTGFVHTDVLVMTQLMVQGGCIYSNRPSVKYRCHENNLSRPLESPKHALRLHYMLRYAIRFLAHYLLSNGANTIADIEAHGLNISPEYSATLILSLGSLYSSPELCASAERIWQTRRDVDQISASCRLARRLGFWVIPASEQVGFLKCGWRP